MKVFKELSVRGTPGTMLRLFDALDRNLAHSWSRDTKSEKFVSRHATDTTWRVYQNPKAPGNEGASVFFILDEKAGTARVTNVVPREVGSLTTDEYDSIVSEFATGNLSPIADRLGGYDVQLTSGTISGIEILGAEAYHRLELFSIAANKSTGSSHPFDRARWFDFIVYVHAHNISPDSEMIGRVLSEEFHWSEEAASKLVGEYEFSRELLDHVARA